MAKPPRKPALSIGMATHNDFHGVYFSVQALRLYHADALASCELIIVDQAPDSVDGQAVKGLCDWTGARYVPMPQPLGTSPSRDRVFSEAKGQAVLCMDCHVMFPPGTIRRLVDHYKAAAKSRRDIYSGPMLYDHLRPDEVSTHFDPIWRSEMYGVWGTDERGRDPNGKPFEVWAQGLGAFTCRRDAWPGFHPEARGFGGEEGFIHERFRQQGAKAVCLPWLRWLHRFGRPGGPTYPLTRFLKVRNYVLNFTLVGWDLEPIRAHFVDEIGFPADQWRHILADPVAHTDVITEKGCGTCGADVEALRAQAAEPMPLEKQRENLQAKYQQAAATPSDINQHVHKLRDLASQCDHVTEFGQRAGVSTTALLAGQPKKLVSYDVADQGAGALLARIAGETEFVFQKADVLAVDIERTDLLFIDTQHTARQLAAELERHSGKVRRWICLHDTEVFGERGEDGGEGLLVALRDFCRKRPEWSVIYDDQKNNGLTVLSCHSEDKPDVPGLAQKVLNFTRHAAEHLADGAKHVDPATYEARLDQCATCPARNNTDCARCGCPLAKKAAWKTAHCELGRWHPADEAPPIAEAPAKTKRPPRRRRKAA